ncbi:MAG: IS1 family transposase [Gammaproteobacteria bacterium]|nr:IS1 family transposase [Gammaproteobacteria bacterium]
MKLKNLNFRTWIKRSTHKTICFSKLEKLHDIVIGLLINKVEFGIDIYPKFRCSLNWLKIPLYSRAHFKLPNTYC